MCIYFESLHQNRQLRKMAGFKDKFVKEPDLFVMRGQKINLTAGIQVVFLGLNLFFNVETGARRGAYA